MYYIEIPQELTNENAITLVYCFAQQKTNTSCNTTDGLINAHFIIEAPRLITDI